VRYVEKDVLFCGIVSFSQNAWLMLWKYTILSGGFNTMSLILLSSQFPIHHCMSIRVYCSIIS
jgi:hypothetical protein